MGWIVAVVALSLVMAFLTISELRRPVMASTLQLPDLVIADRAIALISLATFTLAIVNLTLIAATTLP